MSEKKYDLLQVSEGTRRKYLETVLAYGGKGYRNGALVKAHATLLAEAEVKPKTAREILEQFLEGESRYYENTYDDACAAIKDALKVLP